MSADNGIYILKLKDQCRVIMASAIDNLYNYNDNQPLSERLIRSQVVEYFKSSSALTLNEAIDLAFSMEKEMIDNNYQLEYGIRSIYCTDYSWEQLISGI